MPGTDVYDLANDFVSIMIRTPDIENLAPYMETESNSRYLVCLMDC